ncbi:GAF and ANTAR domain-containing protein [Modestobacter roseus]|uniref:GAF domain-containing protein n=1 Tax=Modestobacter roseus TaxID=1181884 RepID=A0A562ILT5_9ACTN|nr:GAF and ANTAR domain-containing protein [Modestobacter roseus]MQA35245.1 ANTAR domain-containing protein [Modestobacter roseus]TWH71977.1 GAF domain-containing protein [Modestobacter roseus]
MTAREVHTGLGEVLGRVARQLQEEHGDVEGTLRAITAAAVGAVPHADECGITYVIGRTQVEPRAWTSELPRSVDHLQQEVGEGPCMDAVWQEHEVLLDDIRSEQRWPQFAARASELGVGSMQCFQLFVEGGQMGVLNLYSRTPEAFDDESREVGRLFASHAAIALAGAEHERNLRAGITHRDLIGQAKGILMERHKLTADQAFAVLVRTSSLTNRKVRDLAEELTATGELAHPER